MIDRTRQQHTQTPSIAPMLARKTDSVRSSSGSSLPNIHEPSLSHKIHPPGHGTQLKLPVTLSTLSLEKPWRVSFGI